jgi:hypothetical protein
MTGRRITMVEARQIALRAMELTDRLSREEREREVAAELQRLLDWAKDVDMGGEVRSWIEDIVRRLRDLTE